MEFLGLKDRVNFSFAGAWPDKTIVQRTIAQIPWRSNLALLDKLKGPEGTEENILNPVKFPLNDNYNGSPPSILSFSAMNPARVSAVFLSLFFLQ